MKLLTLNYQGIAIHASHEAWFNATEIAALFGKRVNDWLSLKETQDYIARLNARSNTSENGIWIKARRGNNGGTWLHRKLAVRFAGWCDVDFAIWCDVDFAIWCDEQIAELLSGSHTWQAARAESKIAFQVMAEVIQASRQANGQEVKPHHFSNEALLCNAALTGQYKALQRDTLPAAALGTLTRLEARNAALIAQGLPYEARKVRLFALAAPVRCGLQAALKGAAA